MIKQFLHKTTVIDRVFIVLLVSIILPIFIGCFYAMPCADDFYNALGWKNKTENHLVFLFSNLRMFYTRVQGTYFASFLSGIPVYYLFGLTGLRLWLFLTAVLFFVSCFLLVHTFSRIIGFRTENRQTAVLLILTVGLFYLLGTNFLGEVFFWFSGNLVYMIPLDMLLLSAACYLRYRLSPRTGYLIIGSITAFLATGGALNIAALICAIYLFCILYDIFIDKRLRKSVMVAICALAGALVNAVAPGNFLRHNAYDEGSNLPSYVAKAVFRSGYAVFTDFRSGFLLVVVLVVFMFGYKHLKHSEFQFRYPGLMTLYALFAIFITDFPIVMGYASSKITSRGEFVEHLAITMFFILASLYWAGWCAKREMFEFTKTSILILTTMALLFLTGEYAYDTFFNFTPYKMVYRMAIGDFDSVKKKEEQALREILASDDQDVVIYVNPDREGLWVNFARSRFGSECVYDKDTQECKYFKKYSITVKYND